MIERFRILLEQLHISPSEFADRIGVQRSSVSHILSGRNKPSIDFLEKILLAFPDTDIIWLITGKAGQAGSAEKQDYKTWDDPADRQKALIFETEEKKTPAPNEAEPVDHIVIVFKNNTFRLLRPSGD